MPTPHAFYVLRESSATMPATTPTASASFTRKRQFGMRPRARSWNTPSSVYVASGPGQRHWRQV